jgi:hypothetical protein
VVDSETGEPVSLVDGVPLVEPEDPPCAVHGVRHCTICIVAPAQIVEQLPDPVLAAIAAASSYDELLALWREHRWDKDSDYNTAAAARRAQLEEAA